MISFDPLSSADARYAEGMARMVSLGAVRGLGFRGSGFRGLGFRGPDLVFGVLGLGTRFLGSGFGVSGS